MSKVAELSKNNVKSGPNLVPAGLSEAACVALKCLSGQDNLDANMSRCVGALFSGFQESAVTVAQARMHHAS